MYFRELCTGKDIASFVDHYFDHVEVLATTLNGNKIQAIKISEGHKAAVLLKGGNHSSEIAGIHALLTMLIEGLKFPFDIYLIPCGNPFDYGGYQYALSYAIGEKVQIDSDSECFSILTKFGKKIYEEDHFILFQVGKIIFTYVNQEKLDPRTLFYGRLDEITINNSRLRYIISGKRIFFPNTIYYREDYGPYDKGGLSAWTSKDGFVSNLNRLYDRYEVPPELSSIRKFCEKIQPAMVIDLHESCINTRIPKKIRESNETIGNYFLILPPEHESIQLNIKNIETKIAEEMIKGPEKNGFKAFSRKNLEASWGYQHTDYFEGYLRKDVRDAMPFYRWAIRFADISITSETIMNIPIEKRINIHIALVHSALNALARSIKN